VELPSGASKLKAKDNEWWQRYRAKYAAMQNGNRDSEPGRTDEDL
jgi:hypothetical protein